MKRYRSDQLTTPPKTVPVTGFVDAADLYRRAGLEPDERFTVSRLKKSWSGHSAGAFVIFGDGEMVVFERY